MRKFVCVLSLIACSCMTTDKARKLFDRNPEDFADLSLKHFPCLPDSAGKIPQYKPARNINYTSALDSLKRGSDSLRVAIARARVYASDSIGQRCADLVARYEYRVTRLAATIDSLRLNYRAPKPDTVPAPYPVVSTAEKKIIESLRGQLASKDTQIAQRDTKIAELKIEIVKHWIAHGVVMLVVGLGIFLKIKKILPV